MPPKAAGGTPKGKGKKGVAVAKGRSPAGKVAKKSVKGRRSSGAASAARGIQRKLPQE